MREKNVRGIHSQYSRGKLQPVWNTLKTRLFPLPPSGVLAIQEAVLLAAVVQRFMIVCSCNVITDHDIRNVIESAAELPPRSINQIYGCLGCSAQCGRCARTVRNIVTEALGSCAKSCVANCPHSALAANTQHVHDHHHGPAPQRSEPMIEAA